MTTDNENFPRKLTAYLDIGAAELKAGTAYRLQNARAAALARLAGSEGIRSTDSRLAHAFAGGGGSATSGGRSLWTSARLWLGIAIIVAAGFGYQQWQVYQQVNDIVELDAQILSSDLPIDAYLDQGFRNWLAHDED
jgi:zona occludens toxin (predicted ATPase)